MSDIYSDACVLVSGGAGFIGSHVVDALLELGTKRVVVVDNMFLGRAGNLEDSLRRHSDSIVLYREDAGDVEALGAIFDAERPSIVFNLATKPLLYSFFNPAGAFAINTDVAMAFAEFLRQDRFDRLVHISSSEVFGTARTEVISEDHPFAPETSYAAGKAAADLLLRSYVGMFRLPILILRPFNNYGPRQNDDDLAAVVPATLRRLREGKNPVIEGDGLQTRDFAFVEDTAKQIVTAAALDVFPDEFNLGSGRETAISEIIRLICDLSDYSGGIDEAPERTADVRRHRADVGKLENALGPVERTSLEEGLHRTVEWYQANHL